RVQLVRTEGLSAHVKHLVEMLDLESRLQLDIGIVCGDLLCRGGTERTLLGQPVGCYLGEVAGHVAVAVGGAQCRIRRATFRPVTTDGATRLERAALRTLARIGNKARDRIERG